MQLMKLQMSVKRSSSVCGGFICIIVWTDIGIGLLLNSAIKTSTCLEFSLSGMWFGIINQCPDGHFQEMAILCTLFSHETSPTGSNVYI